VIPPSFLQDLLNRVDIVDVVGRYVQPEIMKRQHNSAADMASHGDSFNYYAVPLTSIHLHSNLEGEFEANGEIRYVYIFLAIAGLILLIAIVNFTNLATARGATQAREIGVRKVIGASRKQLIRQFLTDSFLSSFLALLLALGIAVVLLPWFNRLSGKQVSAQTLVSSWTLPCLLAIVLLVGLGSGGYPAFFLSGLQPIRVLQGQLATGFKHGWLRTCLLVFQFGIANVLIIGTPDRQAVYDAADRAERILAMPVNPVIRTTAAWQAATDPLLHQIQASPYLTVLQADDTGDIPEAQP